MTGGSLQRLSTDRLTEVEFMVYIAGCDTLHKILQPIDAAKMWPYDKHTFPHFDIDRVFFSESCLFGHALRYPDG
jgi:hypothetical protein